MAFETPNIHPAPISVLISKLKTFRDIGPKMAERLAYEIVKASDDRVDSLLEAISAVRSEIRFCSFCRGYSDSELCHVCSDGSRDKSRICIVESPDDILAIERAHGYKGVYYSLSDSVSISKGKQIDGFIMTDLVEKVSKGEFTEVIIATNTDIEGDMVASLIKQNLKHSESLKICRLAFGLPVGADIKLADSATLIKSFEGRSEL